MADFFSALGKSRALETIAGTQERAFQTNLAEIQSGSELLKTGLEVEKFKQGRRESELSIKKAETDAAAAAKKAEELARPVSWSAVVDQIERKFPGTGDFITEQAKLFGAIDEDGMTSGEKLIAFEDFSKNSDDIVAGFVSRADAQVLKNAEKIRLQIAELGAEEDPAGISPKMKKLVEQQDAIALQSKEMSTLRAQTQIATDAAIAKEEAKPEPETDEFKRQRDFAKDAATSNERFLLFTDQFAKLDAATTQRGIVVLDTLTKAAAQAAPNINGVDAAREAQRAFREMPIKIQEQLDTNIDPELIRARLVELFGQDGALMWEPMFVAPDQRPNWFVNLMRSAGDFLTGAE